MTTSTAMPHTRVSHLHYTAVILQTDPRADSARPNMVNR